MGGRRFLGVPVPRERREPWSFNRELAGRGRNVLDGKMPLLVGVRESRKPRPARVTRAWAMAAPLASTTAPATRTGCGGVPLVRGGEVINPSASMKTAARDAIRFIMIRTNGRTAKRPGRHARAHRVLIPASARRYDVIPVLDSCGSIQHFSGLTLAAAVSCAAAPSIPTPIRTLDGTGRVVVHCARHLKIVPRIDHRSPSSPGAVP